MQYMATNVSIAKIDNPYTDSNNTVQN